MTSVTTRSGKGSALTHTEMDTNFTNLVNHIAKVWLNFNGTGTVSIRNDSGVSSVTDIAFGFWTANFSSSFSAFDYAVTGLGDQSGYGGGGQSLATWPGYSTTTGVRVHWRQGNQGSSYDTTAVYVVIHR